MSAPSDPRSEHAFSRPDPIEALVRDELARRLATPDLAPTIMQRLGYRPVSHRAARWARLTRWLGRGGTVFAGFAVIALAGSLHSHSPRVRRPNGPTIPAAIEAGYERGTSHLHQLFREFQRMSPVRESAPPATGERQQRGDDHGESRAPVRWA